MLETLREQPDPVSLDALAAALGRHENTVREHLDWLLRHQLVTRTPAPPSGRGRPAWLYAAPGPVPGEDDHVEQVASLIWRLQEEESLESAAVDAGRVWGRELVAGAVPAATETAARRRVVELFDELGYQPTADPDARVATLHRCPLLEAAHRFTTVVCNVHLGVTQTALEAHGADPDAAALTPFSAPGECLLRLADPERRSRQG